MRGKVFRARFRVRSAVGWSDYSPVTSTRAAQAPAPPPAPPGYVAATSSTLSVTLSLCEDNGGAAVLRHELWIDDGALGGFQRIDSYDGHSRSFVVDQATETFLVTGRTYRLRTLAVNEAGSSEPTATTAIALADPPPQANAPTKEAALSSTERLVLSWLPAAGTDAPGGDITGYRLEMDDGLGGDFVVLYDGHNAPSLTTFVVGGPGASVQLVPGRPYRFHLAARAFNGLGSPSAVAVVHTCTAPKNLAPPQLVAVTSAGMTLSWGEPADGGACPAIGYSLLVDDGASGTPGTAVAGVATDVPTLRAASVALPSAGLGSTFTFLLSVSNREGSTPSSTVRFRFAIAPSQPAAGPEVLSAGPSQITVRFDQALPSDGGSAVVGFHLQYMGAYSEGYWRDLVGHDSDTLLTTYTATGLEKGETYFFRYRARNAAGWSAYSPASEAVAASAPARPAAAPSLVGAPTATSVTVELDQASIDDGGSPITAYRLESCQDSSTEDQCLEDAAFSAVASYAGGVQHTLTVATDSLAVGQLYKLRYRAINEAVAGSPRTGEASAAVGVAIAGTPAAPATLLKLMAYSSKTSLSLEWSPVSVPAAESPGGDVLGYVLYASDPETGASWEAFNGATLGLRDVTRANVAGLATGKPYRFRVAA
jgi:hypothetical protein